MGQALARRLLDQGYQIAIWNRSRKDFSEFTSRGADILDHPGSAWSGSSVAISFLANDDAVKEVYLGDNGLVSDQASGRLGIEMSTISPDASAEVGTQAKHKGLQYLRSPVSGNPGVLAAGNLALIVSGPRRAFDDNLAILKAVGPNVHYVGENEQSRIIKLMVNATLAATTAIIAETVLLCESNGIDRKTYLDVLANSSMGSPFVKYKSQPLNNRDYSATFTTAMLDKDIRLALSLADKSGIPVQLTRKVHEMLEETCNIGFADLDFMAILPYLQNLAGKEMDAK